MLYNIVNRIVILIISVITLSCSPANRDQHHPDLLVLDMVHNNPAEGYTVTSFSSPSKLIQYGYDGMVINDFKFVHCAITYDDFDPDIFPEGSLSRQWVEEAARHLDKRIMECREAGIKTYCFIDIVVLPKSMVEKYHSELCDAQGLITLEKPLTIEIHRNMIRGIFRRFPELDGLVIRTGETYLQNVPYHTGNNPITMGEQSHIKLLQLFREEVCEKAGKVLIYRTWDFGNFHVNPEYYLAVTDQIQPHKNLFFSIKHTEGDYHRTFPFNPTLGIGNHQQIVEVQCQREYEGKGAHPNYIMEGVINGFEEFDGMKGNTGLKDLLNNPNFRGIWSWSRGGGWVGPYITNELWCDLNAYVISSWANNPMRDEEEIFYDYTRLLNLSDEDAEKFRELCLLSAKGVVRGHNSLIHPVNVWWTRDQFFGGLDELKDSFTSIIDQGQVEAVIEEKQECVDIWGKIVQLSNEIESGDDTFRDYLKVSSKYGLIKYSIVQQAWIIMLRGLQGEKTGDYSIEQIRSAINEYDRLWNEFYELKANHAQCATLYQPFSFVFKAPEYHGDNGMRKSVDKYRSMIGSL
jgi:hypothetical protein